MIIGEFDNSCEIVMRLGITAGSGQCRELLPSEPEIVNITNCLIGTISVGEGGEPQEKQAMVQQSRVLFFHEDFEGNKEDCKRLSSLKLRLKIGFHWNCLQVLNSITLFQLT